MTDDVVELCRDLIRIDTTNTGDLATCAGERAAAEYVAAKLAEVGLEPQIRESAPGRTSVVARFEGTDPGRDALLVHGHLDVVPADPSEWSVHPFSGELRDGYLWGRGAVDMKDFDAMVLAVVRDWRRRGVRPPRDLVLCFTADEEAGGTYGARFLVDEHPDLFEGCTEAIGEVSQALGIALDLDDPEAAIGKLGPIAAFVAATIRNTANPTRLMAGYKENVIPSRASATIDCRTLPGRAEEFRTQLRALIGPDLSVEAIQHQPALETSFDGPLVEAMVAALKATDPAARAVPYMLSGGTDAKSFQRLGIRCFGFAPLRLPPDLNFAALFHGIDERVPVEGLQFGVRVLDRFLARC